MTRRGSVQGPVVDIDDIAVHALTEEEVVEAIMAELAAGRGGHVVTLNTDIARQLRDPAIAAVARSARLVVADGAPLLWASLLQGTPVPERVTGADLIWSICGGAERDGRTVFLLGGPPGTASRAADVLAGRFPGLAGISTYCPPFGFERDPEEMQRLTDAVSAARPDLVFVGLGFPKQDVLAAQLRRTMPDAWFVGCGAAIAFVSGDLGRAPLWLQRTGLEWAYRLVHDPRRLTRRYLVHGIPFACGLLARAAVRGLRRQVSARRRSG
jgi:N-acetylglucosaminyldiphosphoundecaprenol N-acetyl-beta-D-mannosaminyltransferase